MHDIVAPLREDPSATNVVFNNLRRLATSRRHRHSLPQLSMTNHSEFGRPHFQAPSRSCATPRQLSENDTQRERSRKQLFGSCDFESAALPQVFSKPAIVPLFLSPVNRCVSIHRSLQHTWQRITKSTLQSAQCWSRRRTKKQIQNIHETGFSLKIIGAARRTTDWFANLNFGPIHIASRHGEAEASVLAAPGALRTFRWCNQTQGMITSVKFAH